MDRQRNFGFLLKDLARRYVQRFEQRAHDIALTLPQCKALVRLEHNEGISQVRLAELADEEPMAMVRILDRMEADGLLERRPDPTDRRARCLYLMPKARPVLEEIWHMGDLTRAEIFRGIDSTDREAFMGVLARVYDNACALEHQPIPVADRLSAMTHVTTSAPRVAKSRAKAQP